MSNIKTMTDKEMLDILRKLCFAWMMNDKPQIYALEPLAKNIGEELNRRGGTREMLRVFDQLGPIPGRRTLEMHWNGIGNWRG